MESGKSNEPIRDRFEGSDSPARDSVLYIMSNTGWANERSGGVYTPTGRFARISNSVSELAEVEDAFEGEIAAAHLEDTAQLIGHFLVMEAEQVVTVRSYGDAEELQSEYRILNEAYTHWLGQREGDS